MTKHPPEATRSKTAVAAGFSGAAQTYDDLAVLQRLSGDQLVDQVAGLPFPVARWLDLGCGTGRMTRALATTLSGAAGPGADLAPGMIDAADSRDTGSTAYLVADMKSLPFSDRCFDLLVSNFAVQWCERLASVLQEGYRLLRPGGAFALTSVVDGSLVELEQTWRQVDGHVHVNRFRDADVYRRTALATGFRITTATVTDHTAYYPDMIALMRSLKGIGAANVNPGRARGLTPPSTLAALANRYDALRTERGLPLSYRVLMMVLQKPAA